MTRHLTADVGLLENVHRLQQQGVLKSESSGQLFNLLIAREAIEYGIEIVKCMSNLIDRLLLLILERSIFVESILLKEETNLIARG